MTIVPCVLAFSLMLAAKQQELNHLQKTANNSGETAKKRFDAIVEIFRKHVNKQVDLESLSKTMGGAAWLDASGIAQPGLIAGLFPVDWTLDDSLFCIQILAFRELKEPKSYGLYIAIEGALGPSELEQALKGEFPRQKTKKMKIRDCTICDGPTVLYHMADRVGSGVFFQILFLRLTP